ncbi:MAG: glycosyltransferase family 9 protein [Acidobacteria bacterium]|nr:glycosyltransferase family 9 protein [Acidobacteriota bacterium]
MSQKKSPREYRKIFVSHPYGLGDLVLILPTLHSLKRNLPECEINLGVSGAQDALARTLVGTVVDRLTVLRHSVNTFAHLRHFATEVRRYHPDLFVEFSGTPGPTTLGCLSGTRHLHPCREDVWTSLKLLPVERLQAPSSLHKVDRCLELLRHLDLCPAPICFDFPVPEPDLEAARKLIQEAGLEGKKLAGIIPRSTSRWKNWPLPLLEHTLAVLTGDFGYHPVVFGVDPTYPLDTRRLIDLRARTPLVAYAYLLRYSGLFEVVIGVDTGPMQIAGCINSDSSGNYGSHVSGTPTVSLFGPTDARRFRPYDPTGKFNVFLQAGVVETRRDPAGYALNAAKRDYMNRLTPSMIIDAVIRAVGNQDSKFRPYSPDQVPPADSLRP